MRRHEFRMRDPVPFDQRQRRFGIEFFHHDHCSAQLVHAHAPAQGRRMIKRRGRQVDGVGRHAIGAAAEFGQRVGLGKHAFGQIGPDPLGPAGRARRIEHVGAGGFIADRRDRKLAALGQEIARAGGKCDKAGNEQPVRNRRRGNQHARS